MKPNAAWLTRGSPDGDEDPFEKLKQMQDERKRALEAKTDFMSRFATQKFNKTLQTNNNATMENLDTMLLASN